MKEEDIPNKYTPLSFSLTIVAEDNTNTNATATNVFNSFILLLFMTNINKKSWLSMKPAFIFLYQTDTYPRYDLSNLLLLF